MTISNPRIEVKDAASAAWFGLPDSANVPARVTASGLNAPVARGAERSAESRAKLWARRARQIVIDIAVVLAVMTAIPVLTVSLLSSDWWRTSMRVGNTRAKVLATEPLRAVMIPKDPSITPLEAGRAFAALQPLIPGNGGSPFPMVDVARPVATWRGLRMAPGMFATAKPTSFDGPNSELILQAAAVGFSAQELAYLRTLATAPIWRDYDRVARAPTMDVVGGRFVLPFKSSAWASNLPINRFGSTKEMAWAAVSRAAYHYAIGQRDSAETILRSIVSYGFAVSDNGVGLTDQLMGRVIVEIGRSGLEHFYVITRDPRVAGVRPTSPDNLQRDFSPPGTRTIEELRQELLTRANDPNEIRGIRYYALEQLSWSSCTNVRELLFGVRPDVSEAFERAKRDLARFPSERAILDLIHRSPDAARINTMTTSASVPRFMIGAASIAGTVLRNPRLATCTWFATGGWYGQ